MRIDLVARAVERQGLGPLQAACAIEADRLRRAGRGCDVTPVGGQSAASCRPAAQQREKRNQETLHLVATVPGRLRLCPWHYANITLARDGAVARLTLNRPDRRNALTHAMMLELEDAFGAIRDDPTCRALVLRGAGGHFCAGGDLDAMADMPPPPANGAIDPLVAGLPPVRRRAAGPQHPAAADGRRSSRARRWAAASAWPAARTW